MQTVASLLRFSLFWLRMFFSFPLSSDGKPFFQPEKATRGRMPFPRPPPSSNSNPMSNTSSNFQTPKTNWKWLHPGAVFNDGCDYCPLFLFRFINLGWNEFRYLGTSIIKALRFVNYTTRKAISPPNISCGGQRSWAVMEKRQKLKGILNVCY